MTYIIAELGSTHDGSVGNALRMVETFAELGADAVKFQDHRGQMLGRLEKHPSPHVRSETRDAYYRRTAFHASEWADIFECCEARGADLVVSPFSLDAVELLTQHEGGPDAWKIASGEVTNRALLEAVKATGKPVYLSSGMTTLGETETAAWALYGSLRCLMHCTSEYPCAPERVGINYVEELMRMKRHDRNSCARCLDDICGFQPVPYEIGLSDHTLGLAASLAAITLGATVIERHVTLSRRMYGSDAAHSLEPDEFARFVREVRELDRMLANPVDKDELVKTPEIQAMREVFLCR